MRQSSIRNLVDDTFQPFYFTNLSKMNNAVVPAHSLAKAKVLSCFTSSIDFLSLQEFTLTCFNILVKPTAKSVNSYSNHSMVSLDVNSDFYIGGYRNLRGVYGGAMKSPITGFTGTFRFSIG